MRSADHKKSGKYRKKILRYFIIMIFAVLCVVLLWCKLDGIRIISAQYGPQQEISIGELRVYPFLLPDDLNVKPGRLFKYNATEIGPHIFRISFRDFGKKYDKVGITYVSLSNLSGTWTKKLTIHNAELNEWKRIEPQSWTNEFYETWFFAMASDSELHNDIELTNEDVFIAEIRWCKRKLHKVRNSRTKTQEEISELYN